MGGEIAGMIRGTTEYYRVCGAGECLPKATDGPKQSIYNDSEFCLMIITLEPKPTTCRMI